MRNILGRMDFPTLAMVVALILFAVMIGFTKYVEKPIPGSLEYNNLFHYLEYQKDAYEFEKTSPAARFFMTRYRDCLTNRNQLTPSPTLSEGYAGLNYGCEEKVVMHAYRSGGHPLSIEVALAAQKWDEYNQDKYKTKENL